MSYAIRTSAVGGPEQLRWESVEVPPPGEGEVQLRQTAIGLNFIDVYYRTGLYPAPLPMVPGQEGAGEVVAVGKGVTGFAVGDRVAYQGLMGAYAEVRNAKAERLVTLPKELSDTLAAAVMLKGMTAEYLLHRCHRVQAQESILFHAAAGGVGQLACQWAKQLGARVIGTVGSEAKAAIARRHGCDEVVVLPDDGLVAKVKALTGGKGVPVVYDSVGKDTLAQSLDCLAPRGLLVSFGQSSGKPPPLDLGAIGGARSLYVTRPSLHAYTHSREELLESAKALFAVLASGAVKVEEPRTFRLRDAAEAHRALEGRQTTGSVVLVP